METENWDFVTYLVGVSYNHIFGLKVSVPSL